MTTVDAHCHASLRWFEPVETLLFVMDRSGVERAVLTQILHEYDNSYQQECRHRYPERLASVVGVDASRSDAVHELERLVDEGARGVRLRPTARSSGGDPYAIWRAAERLGIAVSCLGSVDELLDPDFEELLLEVPRLQVVLEHLGAGSHPATSSEEAARRRRVFELAKYPGVSMKVHGLGEVLTRRLPVGDERFEGDALPAFLDAYRAFGSGRLMWGSDFPPVASREGYAAALNGARRAFSSLPAAEQESIFGGAALAAFF